jgi:hypothetical protein
MVTKTTNYQFHHMGIPTDRPREGERYSSTFKMYTSGGENSEYRIQYHRFEADCPLHPLIKTKAHVAFKVDSIAAAIKDKEVILAPYEPIPGFKVAMIAECGVPIEFIETKLSEEEIWYSEHKNTLIYPEND